MFHRQCKCVPCTLVVTSITACIWALAFVEMDKVVSTTSACITPDCNCDCMSIAEQFVRKLMIFPVWMTAKVSKWER